MNRVFNGGRSSLKREVVQGRKYHTCIDSERQPAMLINLRHSHNLFFITGSYFRLDLDGFGKQVDVSGYNFISHQLFAQVFSILLF